ncbi:MAG: PAS domain S-box protein [Verrucomicrobiota bacterium]
MNKPRLFIVEDEAIVAADIAIRLTQLGFQVAGTATSGEEALARVEQIQPDLVLMDIRLQGTMDGIATAHELRKRHQLPVIFLTAYAEGATFQRAKLAEPFGYILKPFEDRELEIVIDLAFYKHQSERKVKQIEQRHKTIIQTSMDGFWLVGDQSQLLEVNETYCRMSGYSEPELLAMRVSDLEVHESAVDTSNRIQKIIEQGADRFESTHRRKDGSLFEVEVSVLYQAANDHHLVAFIRDITERKRAANFLQLVLENIPDFVFWKDRNSAFLGCNNNFAQAAGVGTPDQIIGKTDYDMAWKKEESDFYVRLDRQVMENDQAAYHIIEPQRQADGKQAWLDTCKVPLHDAQGHVIGTLGTYVDITARKLAEERLLESETQLRVILESTIDGILAVDNSGKVVRANHRFAELWQIPWQLLEDGDDKALLECVLTQLSDPAAFIRKVEELYGSDAVSFDTLAFKDGRVFERYSAPMIQADTHIGRVWSFRDVTEQRRNAAEVQELNAQLEQRVQKRTAQLEAANKELESFSYSVSHDLRAPLRAVDGYTRMLLDDFAPNLSDEGQRICAVISQSARNMGKLIDDLLAFSRIGRTSLELSTVDMETLVHSLFYEVTSPADRARIDLRVGPLAAAVADPTLLRQLWVNLLSNAVKFSSKKPRARIKVKSEVADGAVVYSIQDNGAGFDMQYVGKLFGVFQRLHSNKEFEGTGVGLAIVHRIIERHRGQIWAKGELDMGATFFFTLNPGDQP